MEFLRADKLVDKLGSHRPIREGLRYRVDRRCEAGASSRKGFRMRRIVRADSERGIIHVEDVSDVGGVTEEKDGWWLQCSPGQRRTRQLHYTVRAILAYRELVTGI